MLATSANMARGKAAAYAPAKVSCREKFPQGKQLQHPAIREIARALNKDKAVRLFSKHAQADNRVETRVCGAGMRSIEFARRVQDCKCLVPHEFLARAYIAVLERLGRVAVECIQQAFPGVIPHKKRVFLFPQPLFLQRHAFAETGSGSLPVNVNQEIPAVQLWLEIVLRA